jgi:hypothetical protein
MSQFLTAQVQIEGSRPILWHAFGPDALGDGSGKRKEREGTAGNDPGEWRKTVLMTEDRQLFLKPTYVFGCLRDGAKYTSRKRGTLQGPLSSTLQVLDEIVLIDRVVPAEPLPTDPKQPVYLDISGVKNPATRGRNVRYRVAASIGWKCGFSIMWDQTIISRGEMESVLNDAGKLCGLGDGRSIGYGRFNVLSFEAESA